VKVKCFGCDALIEADDSDAVADAFVAHGQESHAWPYPQEAIRNYARNYAEATERLTGATERLSEIGAVTVQPVTEDRVDDWLRFFDHDAFAGNPDWASCYCLEPHVPAAPEQPERAWRETRATVAERLRSGTTFGYLAYVDGRPAGWVNASLRSDYGLYRLVDPGGPEPRLVIGVSCFIIAPPFRRHGIATQAISAVRGPCTTHADSSRSRCGNVTQWCAGLSVDEPPMGPPCINHRRAYAPGVTPTIALKLRTKCAWSL
jgi:hypothetical protein